MDRIERHDVINAIGLAAVLLAMALGLVFGARSLFNTINGGLVDKTEDPAKIAAEQAEQAAADAAADGTDSTDADTTDTTEAEPVETTSTTQAVRPPGEVTIRVGNGARKGGVAGAGTDLLTQAGYIALSPKNAPTVANSVVYYIEGYEADAAQVARLTLMGETAIAPMPADPGVPIDGAQLVVILGQDTAVG
ncbi:MAG: LytR C-terminal domain-containing protein [Acidimicrobiales bacterium]